MLQSVKTTGELAALLDADIEGNSDILVQSAHSIIDAQPGNISFLSDDKYEKYIYDTEASAVLVNHDFVPKSELKTVLIRVKDMNMAKHKLMYAFSQVKHEIKGVSERSMIASSAVLDDQVSIGHFSTIAANTKIGAQTTIGDQVWIAADVTIGTNCMIHSGVKIYQGSKIGNHVTIHANAVIGSDGFGFLPDENGVYKKIAQIGTVTIGDHVEIGSNTVIDRAVMGETVIESGVKLDNLIQIAHNVRIKKNTVIAAQAGIAGSTTIGSNCMIGGQAGIVGHVQIANGTQIQAQSGVAGNVIEENTRLYGSPAIEYRNYLRSYAVFKQLPRINELLRKISRYLPPFKKAE